MRLGSHKKQLYRSFQVLPKLITLFYAVVSPQSFPSQQDKNAPTGPPDFSAPVGFLGTELPPNRFTPNPTGSWYTIQQTQFYTDAFYTTAPYIYYTTDAGQYFEQTTQATCDPNAQVVFLAQNSGASNPWANTLSTVGEFIDQTFNTTSTAFLPYYRGDFDDNELIGLDEFDSKIDFKNKLASLPERDDKGSVMRPALNYAQSMDLDKNRRTVLVIFIFSKPNTPIVDKLEAIKQQGFSIHLIQFGDIPLGGEIDGAVKNRTVDFYDKISVPSKSIWSRRNVDKVLDVIFRKNLICNKPLEILDMSADITVTLPTIDEKQTEIKTDFMITTPQPPPTFAPKNNVRLPTGGPDIVIETNDQLATTFSEELTDNPTTGPQILIETVDKNGVRKSKLLPILIPPPPMPPPPLPNNYDRIVRAVKLLRKDKFKPTTIPVLDFDFETLPPVPMPPMPPPPPPTPAVISINNQKEKCLKNPLIPGCDKYLFTTEIPAVSTPGRGGDTTTGLQPERPGTLNPTLQPPIKITSMPPLPPVTPPPIPPATPANTTSLDSTTTDLDTTTANPAEETKTISVTLINSSEEEIIKMITSDEPLSRNLIESELNNLIDKNSVDSDLLTTSAYYHRTGRDKVVLHFSISDTNPASIKTATETAKALTGNFGIETVQSDIPRSFHGRVTIKDPNLTNMQILTDLQNAVGKPKINQNIRDGETFLFTIDGEPNDAITEIGLEKVLIDVLNPQAYNDIDVYLNHWTEQVEATEKPKTTIDGTRSYFVGRFSLSGLKPNQVSNLYEDPDSALGKKIKAVLPEDVKVEYYEYKDKDEVIGHFNTGPHPPSVEKITDIFETINNIPNTGKLTPIDIGNVREFEGDITLKKDMPFEKLKKAIEDLYGNKISVTKLSFKERNCVFEENKCMDGNQPTFKENEKVNFGVITSENQPDSHHSLNLIPDRDGNEIGKLTELRPYGPGKRLLRGYVVIAKDAEQGAIESEIKKILKNLDVPVTARIENIENFTAKPGTQSEDHEFNQFLSKYLHSDSKIQTFFFQTGFSDAVLSSKSVFLKNMTILSIYQNSKTKSMS